MENKTGQISMMYKIKILILLTLLVSCNNKVSKINSPLVSIIQLQSSENAGEFNEAKKYQDINKLYGKYAEELSVTPEKYWKDIVTASNKLAGDKKFSNQFSYFDYNIEEIVDGNRAKVVFNNKSKLDRVQSIIYDLKLVDSTWVLQEIGYKTTK
ncbi:hypothetical protein [Pedobacter frigoris]|uniref:hypothetical protein n=1 Tax=Pedobacter frigoris TaxID=2571272 RepID=UPI00292F8D16|nr:hypothetical protein [Pedobacter frigoris]